ncbi:MAG: discoidin domain-containing protein [Actinomycetota bacterium]
MTTPIRRPRWAVFLAVAIVASLLITARPDATEPAAAVVAPSSPINPDTLSPYPSPTGGVIGFTQSSISNQSWQVRDFTQVGDRVFVGGSFTQVVATPFAGAQTWDQPFLAAFDVDTGAYITTWTPVLDDVVWSLQSYNGLLYVGGEFDTVNGVPRQGLVALDPITGAIDPTFAAQVDNVDSDFEAAVRDLHVEGNDLYVVGEFNRLIDAFFGHGRYSTARVDAVTGEVDDAWVPRPTSGGVFAVDSDPARGRVILAGSFESVDASPDTDNGAVVSHTDGSLLLDQNGAVAYPMPLNAPNSRGWYATVIDGDHHWYAGEEHISISRNADTWAIEGCLFTGFGGAADSTACTRNWTGASGGGDYQVGELLAPDVLLWGCHCRGNYYSDFDNEYVPTLGYPNGGFRLYRSDGTAYDYRANIRIWGEGPYAAFADSAGCLWVGGDYSGTAQGFGRFCDLEDADGDGVDDFRDTVNTSGPSISQAGTATSSGVWNNDDAAFGPGNAIDGERLGWYSAYPIVHTLNESQSWWEVDLGASTTLAGVNLYNRTDGNSDRLDDVELLIGDAPFGDVDLTTARAAATYSVVIPSTSELSQISLPDVTGQHVRLQIPGNGILNFAELDVFASADTDGDGIGDHRDTVASTGSIVSTGATASQSSDFTATNGAGQAVDGIRDGDNAVAPNAITQEDTEAWWEVDLGGVYAIDGLNLYNRTDCCGERLADFDVMIGDAPFGAMSLADARAAATWTTTLAGAADELTQISVPDIEGQYVRIQLSATDFLQLAEVDVLGTESDLAPFGTPANVVLATNGTDEVTVTWDPVANAKGYLVHRDFQFIGFISPGTTQLVDTGLTQGETYRYQVRAQALDNSYSPPSPIQSITVFDEGGLPPFGTPANATLSTNGVDQVDISWEGVADAKGYVIHRDFQFVRFVPFTETSWTDTDVVEGESYRYQIRAQAQDNSYSIPTPLQSITVFNEGGLPPFGTPANPQVTTNGIDQVSIAWDQVADAKGYVIHRDFQFVRFVPFTESSWVDTDVVQGETYRYQIRAQAQDNSYSAPTALQSVTVFNDGGLPPFGTPANVNLTTNDVDQVTITWEQVADAKGYVVHRDFQYIGFVSFTETSLIDPNVSFGNTYRYQVRAQAFDNSYSQPSAIQSIGVGQDVTPPSVPQNVILSVGADGSVTVDWDPSTDDVGVDSYLVHRNWVYRGFTGGATTDFTDDTVEAGTLYRYQVRARDDAGNLSAPSEIVSITP